MPAIFETRHEQPPQSRLARSRGQVPLAEVLEIPEDRIINIEHPCLIRDLAKGIKSMGGEPQMKHLIDHHVGDSAKQPQRPLPEPEIGISLRPGDPFASRITSVGVKTRNVLMRVTIPKRTGRKRKRGSEELWTSTENASITSITAPELLKRLRDNENSYVIKPVGMVKETHRVRNLPDFQLKAGDVPIFEEIGQHIMTPTYDALKGLNIAPDQANGNVLPGPPSFAATTQPYRYEYQQAAGVRFSQDNAGNVKSLNVSAPARKIMKAVAPDAKEVPQAPPPELKAGNPHGTILPKIVKELKELLEERPLITRRVAMSRLPHLGESTFREATQWVGYSFKAGPWRDCLIKYGVDPRKDPKFGKYQTLMFQLDKRAAKASTDNTGRWNRSVRHVQNADDIERNSHVFDGDHVSLNGKTWQLCDITDPMLKKMIDEAAIRETCDTINFGWYHNGTICKCRVVMREKMEKLFEGQPIDHELFSLIARIPDKVGQVDSEVFKPLFEGSECYREACAMCSEIVALCKSKSNDKRIVRKNRPSEQTAATSGAEDDNSSRSEA